jgi:hypothetical protein
VFWQLSTATTEVLDGGRQRRYCRIIFGRLQFAAPSTSPAVEHVRISGLRPRFVPLLKPLPGCPFVRRHVRETGSRIGLHLGLRPDADPIVELVGIITLPRRYACQKSMRREMRSARPFTPNNSGIDARNGQAYHGRKTTTTNGTRPTAVGSRAGEEHRTRRQRRGRFTPCVRPRAGAACSTRVLRVGSEAAIARSSMR